ncbi:major facilitator superfamily domain-containing protein [Xylariales sp. PMI_506]|nr:major facilitator superfamily domain-containing protein [Xylariales sp. PMI_506]
MSDENVKQATAPPEQDNVEINKHDVEQQKPAEAFDEIEVAKQEARVFTPEEEHKYLRKIDRWIIPLMMVTYFLQSYDKGILSSSTQFGIETDLGLETTIGYTASGTAITDSTKYSNTSLIFYIGYLVANHYSMSRVIAIATFFWGVVVMSTAGCTNYAGLMVNRFVLGFLESTVAPSFAVLVTFWWTREEQVFRTGIWYSAVGMATTISPMLNYALGIMKSSLAPWKGIFLVLGAITIVWSSALWFFLPDNPLSSRFLDEKEKAIALDRLKRNNAGTVSNQFDRKQFWEALADYKMWSSFLIIFCTGVPSGALGTFGTVVINGFGFSHEDSLALTCPIGAATCLSILIGTYLPRKIKNTRYVFMIITAAISLAGTGICWLGQNQSRGVLWAGVFLISVQVAAGGLAVTTLTSNISGHTKKATASATTFIGYCLGNIVGPKLFGDSPGPVYHDGFMGSFICLVIVMATAAVTPVLLTLENRKRDKNTGGERLGIYSADDNVTDWENKDFRYLL